MLAYILHVEWARINVRACESFDIKRPDIHAI